MTQASIMLSACYVVMQNLNIINRLKIFFFKLTCDKPTDRSGLLSVDQKMDGFLISECFLRER